MMFQWQAQGVQKDADSDSLKENIVQDHHLKIFSNCSKGPIGLSYSFIKKPKKIFSTGL